VEKAMLQYLKRKLLSIGYGIRDGPDRRGKELNSEKQPSTHGMGV